MSCGCFLYLFSHLPEEGDPLRVGVRQVHRQQDDRLLLYGESHSQGLAVWLAPQQAVSLARGYGRPGQDGCA